MVFSQFSVRWHSDFDGEAVGLLFDRGDLEARSVKQDRARIQESRTSENNFLLGAALCYRRKSGLHARRSRPCGDVHARQTSCKHCGDGCCQDRGPRKERLEGGFGGRTILHKVRWVRFFWGDLVTQMFAGILATLHWEPAGKCLKQKRNAQLSSECKKTERETGG